MEISRIDIATAITQLRTDILEAIEKGKDSDLKFDLKDVEVEFKCCVKKEEGEEFGFKFYLFNGKTTGKETEEVVQTVKLKLNPKKSGKVVQLADEDNPK
ncbi:MAG: hypothetical protein DWQ10_17545 [Calditrichaeota bacterium]|nr:MAG: hypothetical protein DWQ10_17545 [Calditrichota bacterium]